jgi:hypothetical protein
MFDNAYNFSVSNRDTGIIFGENVNSSCGFVICPWSSVLSGLRIDSSLTTIYDTLNVEKSNITTLNSINSSITSISCVNASMKYVNSSYIHINPVDQYGNGIVIDNNYGRISLNISMGSDDYNIAVDRGDCGIIYNLYNQNNGFVIAPFQDDKAGLRIYDGVTTIYDTLCVDTIFTSNLYPDNVCLTNSVKSYHNIMPFPSQTPPSGVCDYMTWFTYTGSAIRLNYYYGGRTYSTLLT